MSTRRFVRVAVIAALYAVFTIMLAPVSFGAVQFRLSEMLKIFVLFDPFLAVGIGLGTFIANTMSPMVGPWELVWMPITDIIGGLIAYSVFRMLGKKNMYIPALVYAVTTGLAVGVMLQSFGVDIWYLAAVPVIISEAILLLVGAPIIKRIVDTLEMRGIVLQE